MINTGEPIPRSPASRVSIDGSKIKFIRESKGLTQLYVATFLNVTTDTVSRWENRRYPTVRWENVEKLAEALQVDVAEILDDTRGEEPAEAEPGAEETNAPQKPADATKRLALLAAPIMGVLLLGVLFVGLTRNEEVHVEATRFLPKHTPDGQPFPVIIQVTSDGKRPFSFILQEKLPDNFAVVRGLPEIASNDPKENTLKWISNSRQTPFFMAYLVQAAPGAKPSGKITFTGQIKADNAPRFEQEVAGDSELEISNYHWIDANSDSTIDDEEILMVYGSAEVLKSLGVDMDRINTIWSAGRYTWDPEKNEYQVPQ